MFFTSVCHSVHRGGLHTPHRWTWGWADPLDADPLVLLIFFHRSQSQRSSLGNVWEYCDSFPTWPKGNDPTCFGVVFCLWHMYLFRKYEFLSGFIIRLFIGSEGLLIPVIFCDVENIP